MKKVKSFLIPIISAVVGGAIVFGIVSWKPDLISKISRVETQPRTEQEFFNDVTEQQKKLFKDFDDVFDKDFFGQRDPFDEMKKMRERMEKHFGNLERDKSFWSNPFDSWFQNRFGGGTVEDIAKREDSNYVYYDVKVEDVEGTSIQTKVLNGYLTITGEIKKETPSGQSPDDVKNLYSSSFTRTFPLPENVDAEKMEMSHEKDKVVIKFPKVSS